MSGTIAIGSVPRWSAASWLFHWALNALAETVQDPDVIAAVHLVDRENLGWFDLADFTARQAHDIANAAQALPAQAQTRFPPDMPGRQQVILHLSSLAGALNTAIIGVKPPNA